VRSDDSVAGSSGADGTVLPQRHYRTLLANERTLLGWQGMALSLLLASIAVQSLTATSDSVLWCVPAVLLAVGGIAVTWYGLFRWRRVDRALRGEAPAPLAVREKPCECVHL
jgi:uncharacterized membrane protein YidH (DUF202 family)